MNKEKLSKQHETKSVADLVHLYENDMLDLSPAFQRKSVWALKDRRKLIETVIHNYPLPAIFLYKNQESGRLNYSVIDGKQRLETLLGFLGYIRAGGFDLRVELPTMGMQVVSTISLKRNKIHRENLLPHFMSYKIPVIEVEGPLSDIVEVFVRINSTGKPLIPQERRQAKYSGSNLLVEATRLANKFETHWKNAGILSDQQISRMKHVEFSAELLLTVNAGDVINKKSVVDKVMLTDSISATQLQKDYKKAVSAVNHVKNMFPELVSTRFKQIVDYYSLVGLVAKLESEGAILGDKKRNRLAWGLLKAFSIEVDNIRDQQRKLLAQKPDSEIYRDYLLTVSQMTDDVSQRRRREQILRTLIGSIFSKKDGQRGFTKEQRRILWNSTDNKNCSACKAQLSWNNFTIDHIDPYSKGGKAELVNAALMCRSCNSTKGSRRTFRRKVIKSFKKRVAYG